MTAAWILVLLFVAWVSSRMMRSTKMWWFFVITILAGLLVGMMGKEVSKSQKDDVTSITQLINTVSNLDSTCTQCIAAVTTGAITYYEVVSYNVEFELPTVKLTSNHVSKGRDSPGIEDDS